MGRSVSWETMQKLFSYECSLRNPWDYELQKLKLQIKSDQTSNRKRTRP